MRASFCGSARLVPPGTCCRRLRSFSTPLRAGMSAPEGLDCTVTDGRLTASCACAWVTRAATSSTPAVVRKEKHERGVIGGVDM